MEIKYLVSGYYLPKTGAGRQIPFRTYRTTDHPLSQRLIEKWEEEMVKNFNAVHAGIQNVVPMHTSA